MQTAIMNELEQIASTVRSGPFLLMKFSLKIKNKLF